MRRARATIALDVNSPDRITSRSRERVRERRERSRRRVLKWAGALVLLAVVFFAGLAVGKALESDQGTETQTSVRTLLPTTVTPLQTVTVTVSKP
jgi:predicted anti-sigma-YlaC factor YlaD